MVRQLDLSVSRSHALVRVSYSLHMADLGLLNLRTLAGNTATVPFSVPTLLFSVRGDAAALQQELVLFAGALL